MKITSPISLSRVASIIGCGSADVSKVCTHININKHSLRKPTYIAKSDTESLKLDLANYKPSGRAGTKSVGYGLIVPTTSNKTYQQLFNYFAYSAKVWTHTKPTTTDDNWKNLAHFNGYSTTATEAESIIKVTKIHGNANLEFEMTTKWGGDESVSPHNIDFGFKVYPCVMVCVNNVPTWLFGSTKPIKECDSVLSFATTDSEEKVNENKIYTFIPFLSNLSPQYILNQTSVTTATTHGLISPSAITTATIFAYGSYNLVAKVNALQGIANNVTAIISVSKVVMINNANRVDQTKACVTVYMVNNTAENVSDMRGSITWSATNKSGSHPFTRDMLAKDETFSKDFDVDITGTENDLITFNFEVQYRPDGMDEIRQVECDPVTFVNDISIPAPVE